MPKQKQIFFSHGNGFPNLCYSKLFSKLNSDFEILYTDKLGHNEQFPITDNWIHLIDELIDAIEQQADDPVIGVGHSFGGVLTLLAAMKKPECFAKVIMLDSPILSPIKAFALRQIKKFGLVDYVTPARKAKNRKITWQSREEARDYFKAKELFKYFDPECLDDYVQYGLKDLSDGVGLEFEQNKEYLIFRTLPDNFFHYYKHIEVPTGVIFGQYSNVISRADVRYMRHNYKVECIAVEGTHMFPFESPGQTSGMIKEMIHILK